MFIDYMYANILFPLTKAIPIMLSSYHINSITWMDNNATRYHKHYHPRYNTFSLSLTYIGHHGTHYHNFNTLPHALRYIFSQISMVEGAIYNGLRRVTVKFIKECILTFF